MDDTIHNESIRSYVEILEMFLTVTSDIIRKICYEYDEIIAEKRNIYKVIIRDFFKDLNTENELNDLNILDLLILLFNNYAFKLIKEDALSLIRIYLLDKEHFLLYFAFLNNLNFFFTTYI